MNSYHLGTVRHSKKKLIVIISCLLTVVALAATGYILFPHEPKPKKAVASRIIKPEIVQSTVKPESLSGHYLFNGTIFWGRGIEHWAQKPDGTYDYAHPFSGLGTFGRDKYDAWVADLECPITSKDVSFKTQVDDLIFNCRPEYTAEAGKYFNILDLANNHTDNMGPTGLPETRANLEKNNIQHFGNYDPGVASDTCEIISLPIKIVNSDKTLAAATLPVAFCAWHYFYRLPKDGEIEAMKVYSSLMPVFAFVHMGVEYNTVAQPTQVEIAHKVADQNPEFVIANNPHWIQNSEAYKGKLIVYSTGNFIFDQLDSEGMRSASIDLTATTPYNADLQKWLDIGPKCTAFHDSCLNMIKQAGLAKPRLSLKYDVVAGDNSGKLTKKGSDQLLAQLKTRLDWDKTMKALSN
jgi:hypothetical protein